MDILKELCYNRAYIFREGESTVMWWNRMILGFDSYHVILWFLLYSILGWIVESIYMSICNRKLTNRGFAKGPFCPIYGVGALTVYFVLRPYSSNGFLLFLLGSLLATALELLTGIIMKRIFGEIWWDYHEKPFNYKGILCLESSIAWGFYTIGLFVFLHKFVEGFVNGIPMMAGKALGGFLAVLFTLDFANAFYREKREALPKQLIRIREGILNRFSR